MATWERNASTVNLLHNMKTHGPLTTSLLRLDAGAFIIHPCQNACQHSAYQMERGRKSWTVQQRQLWEEAMQSGSAETQKHSNKWLWFQCLTSTQREERRLWPCKTSLIRQSLVRSPGTSAEVANLTLEPFWHPCMLPSMSNYTPRVHILLRMDKL